MSAGVLGRVLVLGGGPDAERAVSLRSSAAVAEALRGRGFAVEYRVVDRLDAAGLAELPGDVVVPVLHGSWGEGGGLQDLLEASGRAFVGCGARAARIAMDKAATKLAAARVGVRTAAAAIVHPGDAGCPLALPVVVKPVHEGSSVGLHVCRTAEQWAAAHAEVVAHAATRAAMVEEFVPGREVTVGLLGPKEDLTALPVVEICPAEGLYDYAAKYERQDTRYIVGPAMSGATISRLAEAAVAVGRAIGVRHLSRVDFIVPEGGEPMLLEVNTMPGFTATSLLPKAAAGAGMDFGTLCERLVRLALQDG